MNPAIFRLMQRNKSGFGLSKNSSITILLLCLFLTVGLGPVGLGARLASALEISDPIEPVNRKIFWFNEKFDSYFLKPVSDGFRFIIPKGGRRSIEHFFSNLRYPRQLVSNVVSGKFSRAGIDTARFIINSTLGLAGFFEVTEEFKLERQDEDFGQALSVDMGNFYLSPPKF